MKATHVIIPLSLDYLRPKELAKNFVLSWTVAASHTLGIHEWLLIPAAHDKPDDFPSPTVSTPRLIRLRVATLIFFVCTTAALVNASLAIPLALGREVLSILRTTENDLYVHLSKIGSLQI